MNEKKKLLIVDDEESLRELYQIAFKREGYEVLLASNGRDAVHMAKEHIPDLVIMDIRMPFMDGIDAMHKMFENNRNLPVVFNSAYTMYKENFMSWSADAYVVKNKDLAELIQVVASTLKRCQPG